MLPVLPVDSDLRPIEPASKPSQVAVRPGNAFSGRQKNLYRQIGPGLSSRLDAARALAACLVVLEHLRGGYFVAYPDLAPPSQNPMNAALFFISRLGPEAVIVFFVLSGFLVGGGALADATGDRFKLTRYTVNRLSRMYTVLLPALLAGGICDWLRSRIVHDPSIADNLGLRAVLVNATFLQGIAGPSFGGNLPLWSLAYEFWFYFTWPLVLMPFFASNSRIVRTVAVAGVCCMGALGYKFAPTILAFFPMWILGAVLRLVPPLLKDKRWTYPLMLAVVGAAALSCRYRTVVHYYVLAMAFAALTLHWMHRPKDELSHWSARTWAGLAAFSFTLYAVHYPFIALVIRVLKDSWGWQIRRISGDPKGWFIFCVLGAVVYGYAWAWYLIAERNTPHVRRWMAGLFDRTARLTSRSAGIQ